ncbi:MAG TPA: hypothetical protein VKA95_02000 [Nitrososphaeraceae archaeon]|nr:hypothetical protein [Nitrososphaeraceae archaeon]
MNPSPQLTVLLFGFLHVSTLAGGVSQVFMWPPPFVQVFVFCAEASLPTNEGASATARTAAMPIARNIVFLFIIRCRTEY